MRMRMRMRMRMTMRMNNIVQDEDEDEEVDEGDLEYGDVLLEELEILENITSCDKVFCKFIKILLNFFCVVLIYILALFAEKYLKI